MKAARLLALLFITVAWMAGTGCSLVWPSYSHSPLPSQNPSLQGHRVSYVAVAKRENRVVGVLEVDTSQVHDLAPWGRHAADLCADWYPRIATQLGVAEVSSNRVITLYFHRRDGVANTDPKTGLISFSQAYVHGHTNDWGLVIHELVHTLQSYGTNETGYHGWLSEGIADYFRLALFEPDAPLPRLNPDTASHTNSYRTTATFLRWLVKTRDPDLIRKLNLAIRDGQYSPATIQTITGRTWDELWAEFMSAWRAKQVRF